METRAATVDDLLLERGIVRSPEDALSTPPAAPLADGAVIDYRPAVPVTLIVDNAARTLRTPAQTVGELLADEHVALGSHDTIEPTPDATIDDDTVVHVTHITAWTQRIHQAIAPPVKHVYDFALAPGVTRLLDAGKPGQKDLTLAYSQPDPTLAPQAKVLAAHVVRPPKPRVIALGIGEYASFARFAKTGALATEHLAVAALSMVATAYTAQCSGCSGTTAIGVHAGHGIVAVDPRVIPLGTKLYIPGYGKALAGDTGGAIRGNRIDLGFNSWGDAMQFGRRAIVVYILKK